MVMGVMEARPQWTVPATMEKENKNGDTAFNIENLCAPVIHPSTGKMITKYAELANDTEMMEIWTTAFGKEWGRSVQGKKRQGPKEPTAYM